MGQNSYDIEHRAQLRVISAALLLFLSGGLSAYGQESSTVYLSDMPWVSSTNGWGPVERDRSNGETGANDGLTLTLNGLTYAKGLGAHAPSNVVLDVPAGCTRFVADVGVDDEVGSNGSIVFQVLADGAVVFDSGPMLGPSTTRTVSVDVTGRTQLQLVIRDGGDNMQADHGDWAGARFACSSSAVNTNPNVVEFVPASNHVAVSGATVMNVSELAWMSATNGWGPVERDHSNGESGAGDGATITLNGSTFSRGLGVHAPSEVVLAVPTGCTAFAAEVGVDDEVGVNGSIVFRVLADGFTLFDSGVMNGTSSTRSVIVDVTGRQQVRLSVTDGGDGIHFDHGDWANARFVCSGGQPGVERYDVMFYEAGATAPFMVIDIGKPQPQADGMVRIDLSSRVPAWPMPNVYCEARVVAVSSAGPAVSFPSNTFIYPCDFALSVTSTSISATGGTGSVSVSAAASCGWTAVSSVNWLTVTSGVSGSGPGTVSYSVAPNESGSSRTGTLLIAGLTYTVTQPGTTTTAPTTPSAPAPPGSGEGSVVYLSDLAWDFASNGWGPVERDLSNGELNVGDGRAITLNGVTYTKGLGVHAPSEVVFTIPAGCYAFIADVGVDDEVDANGSMVFRVDADGTTIFDSGVMTGSSATRAISVDVTGKRQLRLMVTDGGDNIHSDHGDWANARFECGTGSEPEAPGPEPTIAPQVTVTSPKSGAVVRRNRSITLAASASDGDGYVTAVYFFVNDVFVASTSTSPYRASWQPTTSGQHTIKAVAVDDDGLMTESVSVSFVVR